MSPPGSPRAVVMPASGSQLGPPSSTPPPPSKRCLFIPIEAHSTGASGLTRLVAGAGVPGWVPAAGRERPSSHPCTCRTLSPRPSPPSILLWAEEPEERSQCSTVTGADTYRLRPLGKRQTQVTDEQNKVQREQFAHIHTASYLSPGLQILNPCSFQQQQPLPTSHVLPVSVVHLITR